MPASEPIPAIPPKTQPWLEELLRSPAKLSDLTARFGSPLHLHHTGPFTDNIAALTAPASTTTTDLAVYFARKANKALCYVHAAIGASIGVDIASAEELDQALRCGADPDLLVVTSAVKPDHLLVTCRDNGVLVVIDNDDEATRYMALADASDRRPPVAVRLSNFGFEQGRPGPSRFGLDIKGDDLVARITGYHGSLDVQGLHFHLDGYTPTDRADALSETLELHDELALAGLKTHFVDIGGGIPVTYTDHQEHWNRFWDTLDRALLGDRTPVTYRNHGYGQIVDNGRVLGPRLAYPHHQAPIGGAWLDAILTATEPGAASSTIAHRLHERALQLRCEPGRALLDGCGATIATVIHTKPHRDGWLIGLDMNSSNCRTQKSELLTDPIHLPRHPDSGPPCSGYLTGAYCSESDLITHRRLPFTQPPARGDLIVFPNTAGYYMHFTESRSHQFPLPHNVHHTADGWTLDPIDQPTPATGRHQTGRPRARRD